MVEIKHSLHFVTVVDETHPIGMQLLALEKEMQIAMLEGMLKELLVPALVPALEDINKKVAVWLASPQSKQDIKDITDGFVAMGEAAKVVLDIILNLKAGMDAVTKFNKELFGGVGFKGTVIVPKTPSTNGGNPSAPGGRGRSQAPTINFNSPIDPVSAGREVSRVLNAYNRSNGGRG